MTMILAGSNITAANDKLSKIAIDYLFHSLRNPKPDVEARIRQLRIIREIDNKQYSSLKRQLPYVVCGIFNPPIRNKDNFAYIEYFMLDIDHLSVKGYSLNELRNKIEKDERVRLCFVSPSEDGLKVMFHLKERCYEPNIYSLFYKEFSLSFAKDHQIEQIVDLKTSDVSRACFISIDPNVYYNTESKPVSISDYMDLSNVDALLELKRSQEKEEASITQIDRNTQTKEKNPEDEIMQHIKSILNPNGKNTQKEQRNIYVPEQLDEIIDQLKSYIESTGVLLYDITNIQYGKKLRLKNGLHLAEINLFYGKKGYSIVQSPCCGTSEVFNQLMADLIKKYIVDNIYSYDK